MMTSPRFRKRPRTQNPAPALIVSAVLLVLFSIGAIFGRSSYYGHRRDRREDDSNHGLMRGLKQVLHGENLSYGAYPGYFLDLWPDDKHSKSYRKYFLECLPPECPDDTDERSKQTIALASPPGKLGAIFVQYVTRILALYNGQEIAEKIELVPITTPMKPIQQQTFSKIIRFATLPVVLEASEILADSFGPPQSIDDVFSHVQQLLQWHCNYNQYSRVSDKPVLTITLDRMMGFSANTIHKLQLFLGLTPFDDKQANRIDLDDLALQVIDFVDGASSQLTHIGGTSLRYYMEIALPQVVEDDMAACHQQLSHLKEAENKEWTARPHSFG